MRLGWPRRRAAQALAAPGEGASEGARGARGAPRRRAARAATGRQEGNDLFDEAFLRKLAYLDIVAKKLFAGGSRGERRARKRGAGLEFADHRRYSPGDDFRHVDWNVYARLGKLLLRLYEEEEDLTVYLLVDTSASMAAGGGRKFDYARRVAAALSYVALANMDRAAVIPFAGGLGAPLPPARGKARAFAVFDFLRGLDAGGPTRLEDSVRAFVHRTRKPGLAVLLSDLYAIPAAAEATNVGSQGSPRGPVVGPADAALDLLRYHRFEPFVLHVTDARERRPALRGDLTLVDRETGEAREVTVTPRVLARYEAAYEARCHAVEAACTRRRVPYLRAPVETPFDDLILRVFRTGGFLR